MWREIIGKKVHLVPLRTNAGDARQRKAEEIRRYYTVSGRFAFIHVGTELATAASAGEVRLHRGAAV